MIFSIKEGYWEHQRIMKTKNLENGGNVMKRSIKRVISIIPTIAFGIAGYYFTYNFTPQFNVGLVIIIVTVVVWVFAIIIDSQSEKVETERKKNVALEEENKRLKNYIENSISGIKQSKSNYRVLYGEDKIGNNLLLMALTQDPTKPLKLKMLEEAANKYNNFISSIILANIYEYGIEKDNKVILKGNREESFKIYLKIHKNDIFGVSAWKLGYYYQNNLVKAANRLSETKRFKCAERFFKESSEKGFPKAKNSLGKLISDKKLGYSPITHEDIMISLYKEASDLGDNYATVNLGNYYLKKYYFEKETESLEKAKELFEKAAEMDTLEAFVKLGVIYIKLDNIEKAQENLEKCTLFGVNQYSASAYFLLGYLAKNYSKKINENRLKSLINKDKGLVEGFYDLSKKTFNVIEQGEDKIVGDSKRYHNLLIKSLNNEKLEKDPLQCVLEQKYNKTEENDHG